LPRSRWRYRYDKKDREKGGKGKGATGEVETQVDDPAEKTLAEQCEALNSTVTLDETIQVNKALERFSIIADSSVECSTNSDDFNSIVRFEGDTRRQQSTQLDRIANSGSTVQAVKDAANAIDSKMLETANFDCSLIVIQEAANILKGKLAAASAASEEAYKIEIAKAQAVIAIFESRHFASSNASNLANNRHQRDWNYMAETHSMAAERLSEIMGQLEEIKGQLNTQFSRSCSDGVDVEDGPEVDGNCTDNQARQMSDRIGDFLESTTSVMESGAYSITGPDDAAVGAKSDSIIALVTEAQGLFVSAQGVLD
jgi:hypothetical protein